MVKHIVITGANSGFGLENAKNFAKDGHNLTLLSVNTSNLEKLYIKNALIKKVDVTNFKDFKLAVDEGVESFGPVDLLINNAGVMFLGEIGIQDREEHTKMFDVNVKGVLNGIEIVVNSMKQRRTGTIINISSTAGLRPYPNHTSYVGTKYAVTGITESLRRELAPYNVRVVSIFPGAFSTNLLNRTTNKKIINDYKNWRKTMGKMAEPIEVAKIIKFIFDSPQELNISLVSLHTTSQIE